MATSKPQQNPIIKPSPSNGGATEVCHEPWWMKGVPTLSLSAKGFRGRGGEGQEAQCILT
jgi:hypothetical protein